MPRTRPSSLSSAPRPRPGSSRSANRPAALHLHDWHCGVTRACCAHTIRATRRCATVPTAFTIHNLAYQGQRPKRGDVSALDTWFPALRVRARGPSRTRRTARFSIPWRPQSGSPTGSMRSHRPMPGNSAAEPAKARVRWRRGPGRHTACACGPAEALTGILNGCEYPRRHGRPPRLAGIAPADRRCAARLAASGPAGGCRRSAPTRRREPGRPRRRPAATPADQRRAHRRPEDAAAVHPPGAEARSHSSAC